MRKSLVRYALFLLIAGCGSDAAGPATAKTGLEVTTDPQGASVTIDGVATGKTTPATFADLTGAHDIDVKLSIDNVDYGFRTRVNLQGDSLHHLFGPLTMRCLTSTCARGIARYYDFGALHTATNANGSLFFYDGNGNGLQWPAGTANSYASQGLPLIAMLQGIGDTLALGLYNLDYLAGRPGATISTAGGTTTFKQTFWITPPLEVITLQYPSVRGIEVNEEISASTNSDVAFVKLTYRNITNSVSYRLSDPATPDNGITFDKVYVAFALDGDIGQIDDDLLTYEPSLDMVYMYDANFSENGFDATRRTKPALLGLRLLGVSDNTAVKVLSAWPAGSLTTLGDWDSGTQTEAVGWRVLSGSKPSIPDYPGQQIGFMPQQPGDYKMSVGAGPFTLAPGQSVGITVAVILAEPVTGTYTSGQIVPPDDPMDLNRPIRQVAGNLINRAKTLTLP